MKIILYLFLGLSVCSLGANGKITTKNPGICGKGIVTTFPTFVSNTPNLSTENGTCYQVNNKFNLWLQCISGPKYVCVLITTTTKLTTTTSLLPTTTPKIITNGTTGPADACIITSITASAAPTTSSNTTATLTNTTSTETPTTTTTETPTTTTTETPTTTSTETPTTTTTETQTTTSTIPPGCTFRDADYSVGQIYIFKATVPLCTTLVCGSSLQMEDVVYPNTTGYCNDANNFTQNPIFGCFNNQLDVRGDFCEARTYCRSIGGDLITSSFLNNTASFNEAMTNVPDFRNVWIGMHGYGDDFYWINESIATNTYNNLKDANIPLSPPYDGLCVYLKLSLSSTWTLATTDCNNPLGIIRCSREP